VQAIPRSQVDAAASAQGNSAAGARHLEISGADAAVEVTSPHISLVYLRRGAAAVAVNVRRGTGSDVVLEERLARIIAPRLP
jgi:hypothetical protein